MSDGKKTMKGDQGIDRRDFLKYAGAAGAALALSEIALPKAHAVEAKKAKITGKTHVLACNEKTSTDGYWDNSKPPVLTIKSGETVYIETGTHLMGKMKPGADINDWMGWYKEVIAQTEETYIYPDDVTGAKKIKKGGGHHHLTGPIYIEDAEPGDFLQVEILEIDPGPLRVQPEPDHLLHEAGAAGGRLPGREGPLVHGGPEGHDVRIPAGDQGPRPAVPGNDRRGAAGQGDVEQRPPGQARRQPRQQGPGRRDRAVPPGLDQGRGVQDRRLPFRAGARGDQPQRAGRGLQDHHVPVHRAQGPEADAGLARGIQPRPTGS